MSSMANVGLTLDQRLATAPADNWALKDTIFQSLRVALPGIVKAFRVGPPAVVDVVIAAKELFQLNLPAGSSGITMRTVSANLPILQDVPIVIPSAGGWSLTLPIAIDDECLVVLCDTALDAWLQSGGIDNEPFSLRRHDLSDGVAIFGLRSKPRALAEYSTISAQLRSDDGSVIIDLASDGVTVTSPAVTVNCSGDATISAASVDIECSGDASISASGKVQITANEVDVTGSSKVQLGPATTIDSQVFLQHKHILTPTTQTGIVYAP